MFWNFPIERRFRDAVDAGVPSAEFITVGGGTSTAPGVTPLPPGSALYPRLEAAPRELERGLPGSLVTDVAPRIGKCC